MKPIGKKILINTISSVILQIMHLIVGLIIPRLIIYTFGSELNGAIQSITQFMSYVTLLEAGAGGVTRAALYRTLSNGNEYDINGVVNASNKFFSSIGYCIIIYTIFLGIAFPYLVDTSFDSFYIFCLVLVIGLSISLKYSLGVTKSIFMSVNQKIYVLNLVEIFVLLFDSIMTILIVTMGHEIYIVKLASCVIFLIKPLLLGIYMRINYSYLNNKIEPNMNAIKERWNAFIQTIASFVNENLDVFLLTFSGNLKIVSVYSIYNFVVLGIHGFISTICTAFNPAISTEIAQGNIKVANEILDKYELILYLAANIAFTTCSIMIVPFVSVYINDVGDINYVNYSFGYAISILGFVRLIRSIYFVLIHSAGHYKQTSLSSYMEVTINIVLSLILWIEFGLTGLAIATIISNLYKAICCINYLDKNIINRNKNIFFKRLTINLMALSINILIYIGFGHMIIVSNFFEWVITSGIVFTIISFVVIVVNFIFYKNDFMHFIKLLTGVIKTN